MEDLSNPTPPTTSDASRKRTRKPPCLISEESKTHANVLFETFIKTYTGQDDRESILKAFVEKHECCRFLLDVSRSTAYHILGPMRSRVVKVSRIPLKTSSDKIRERVRKTPCSMSKESKQHALTLFETFITSYTGPSDCESILNAFVGKHECCKFLLEATSNTVHHILGPMRSRVDKFKGISGELLMEQERHRFAAIKTRFDEFLISYPSVITFRGCFADFIQANTDLEFMNKLLDKQKEEILGDRRTWKHIQEEGSKDLVHTSGYALCTAYETSPGHCQQEPPLKRLRRYTEPSQEAGRGTASQQIESLYGYDHCDDFGDASDLIISNHGIKSRASCSPSTTNKLHELSIDFSGAVDSSVNSQVQRNDTQYLDEWITGPYSRVQLNDSSYDTRHIDELTTVPYSDTGVSATTTSTFPGQFRTLKAKTQNTTAFPERLIEFVEKNKALYANEKLPRPIPGESEWIKNCLVSILRKTNTMSWTELLALFVEANPKLSHLLKMDITMFHNRYGSVQKLSESAGGRLDRHLPNRHSKSHKMQTLHSPDAGIKNKGYEASNDCATADVSSPFHGMSPEARKDIEAALSDTPINVLRKSPRNLRFSTETVQSTPGSTNRTGLQHRAATLSRIELVQTRDSPEILRRSSRIKALAAARRKTYP
jgi:hypothetical protein